ncbi:lysylphosphatidylglycerol synthase transmembrane domain-containing protein [Amycolatopsis sp. 195334CR]|uniref:lysylphosphatidylglycerol synthase transmembrane domain-containing protein n=1 Tax=Amycolatopsis sp. 195334CR TaxID=2814588 RepID=UPI001A8F28A5|nr:lysylphosphatidylglycerol synthase transmembrane domain-containing protein [Amycolatopsis sp. 195334CR]MBN6035359.1 flippase-like domain-containing protein [Amycolatopsis sp. 195334CR]
MTTVEPDETAVEVAGKAPKSTKAKLIDAARWLAIAVVIFFAARSLITSWDEFWVTMKGIPWLSSALSLVALVGSIAVGVYAWQIVVDELGKPIGYARGAQINLVGSLGKYIPGSVWAYLLQMELGRKAGLARARIFTASLIHLGVGVVAALVLSILAMPAVFANSPHAWWLLVLLPVGFTALHPKVLTWGTSLVLRILRRPPLDHQLSYKLIGKVFGALVLVYALQGTHLWLLANSVGAPGFGGFVLCIGAMAIAMTSGTFAFILPSGVGAREFAMVAVLTATAISGPQALAFAVASRVMFTVADLITAGGAALTARLQARRTATA